MNTLNNLKTGTKLIGSFVIVALITMVVAYIGYSNMKSIDDGMTSMYKDRTVPINDLGEVDAGLMQIRGDVYKLLLIPSEVAKSKEEIASIQKDIKERIEKYKATFLLESEKTELKVFEPALEEYFAAVDEIIAWNDVGNKDDPIVSLTGTGRATTARKAIGASAQKLLDINVQEAYALNERGKATFDSVVPGFEISPSNLKSFRPCLSSMKN